MKWQKILLLEFLPFAMGSKLFEEKIEYIQSRSISTQTTVRPLSLQHFTFGSVENGVKYFWMEHSYFHYFLYSLYIFMTYFIETPNSVIPIELI